MPSRRQKTTFFECIGLAALFSVLTVIMLWPLPVQRTSPERG